MKPNKPPVWATYSDTMNSAGRATKTPYACEMKDRTAHAIEMEIGVSAFTVCGRRIFRPVLAEGKVAKCGKCSKVIAESRIRRALQERNEKAMGGK